MDDYVKKHDALPPVELNETTKTIMRLLPESENREIIARILSPYYSLYINPFTSVNWQELSERVGINKDTLKAIFEETKNK